VIPLTCEVGVVALVLKGRREGGVGAAHIDDDDVYDRQHSPMIAILA